MELGWLCPIIRFTAQTRIYVLHFESLADYRDICVEHPAKPHAFPAKLYCMDFNPLTK